MGLIKKLKFKLFLLMNKNKQKFECPVCEYIGPFKDISPRTGLRKHAVCPSCRAHERQRIQHLVLDELFKENDFSQKKMLHFAPEECFKDFCSRQFGEYETADLYMDNVDHKIDISDMPFEDATYDFILASHILGYIPDDHHAISEIRRILKPGGIAIVPITIVGEKSVEYPEPNMSEAGGHIRAPGDDYFQRFDKYFAKTIEYKSPDFPEKYQVYVYEDRTSWPDTMPLRPTRSGERHNDIVPVSYVD